MSLPSRDNEKRPTQFSLRWLFAVTTGIGIVLGAIHWLGAAALGIPFVVLLVFAAVVSVVARPTRAAAILGLGLLSLPALAWLARMLAEFCLF